MREHVDFVVNVDPKKSRARLRSEAAALKQHFSAENSSKSCKLSEISLILQYRYAGVLITLLYAHDVLTYLIYRLSWQRTKRWRRSFWRKLGILPSVHWMKIEGEKLWKTKLRLYKITRASVMRHERDETNSIFQDAHLLIIFALITQLYCIYADFIHIYGFASNKCAII